MRTVQNNRVWRRARCCLGALAAAAPQLRRGHKSEARRNGGVGRLVCVLERAELGVGRAAHSDVLKFILLLFCFT